jgi:exosortase B
MAADAAVLAERPSQERRAVAQQWLPVLLGFAVLYVPTYVTLARTVWTSEDNAHGPLILLIVAWLFWQKRHTFGAIDVQQGQAAYGWLLLLVGLLFYALGRSQDILLFEVGSQIPVLAGVLLIMRGLSELRAVWFPLLYLAFMVPLPGVFVDAATGPLKQWVSVIAEQILYGLGYPIARTGVVLTIGQYQLLVADACSGLNSIFSLAALGSIMLLSIVPIAFCANLVRVMVLVLVTYYMGDEAAQGILHGSAGMFLLLAALIFFVSLDWLLTRLLRMRPTS